MNMQKCQNMYDKTYDELTMLREKNIKYKDCIITALLIERKEQMINDLNNKIMKLEDKYLSYKNTIIL